LLLTLRDVDKHISGLSSERPTLSVEHGADLAQSDSNGGPTLGPFDLAKKKKEKKVG
jgi:hypothetical protein